MKILGFSGALISRVNMISIGGLTLLSAEGRRQFAWLDFKDIVATAGSRLAAVEYRWVVWRLFGVIPVFFNRPEWVELPVTRGLGSTSIRGAEYFGSFNDVFSHPLCRLNRSPVFRRQSDGSDLDFNIEGMKS